MSMTTTDGWRGALAFGAAPALIVRRNPASVPQNQSAPKSHGEVARPPGPPPAACSRRPSDRRAPLGGTTAITRTHRSSEVGVVGRADVADPRQHPYARS